MDNKLGIAYAIRRKKMASGGKLGSGERFKSLEHKLAHKKGIYDAAGLAAAIGRKKYGAKKMGAMSHHHKMAHGGEVDMDDVDDGFLEAGMDPVDVGYDTYPDDTDERMEEMEPKDKKKRRLSRILESVKREHQGK